MQVRLWKDILELGYHAHVSDGDLTYFRPVFPAFENIMLSTGADSTLLTEEVNIHQLLNIGNVYMLSNARTKKLMATLLARIGNNRGDQSLFNEQANLMWVLCDSKITCDTVKSKDLVAVVRHPGFNAGSRDPCTKRRWESELGPCDSHLMYYHVLCVIGKQAKHDVYNAMQLWVLNLETNEPIHPHKYLPCSRLYVWDDLSYIQY